MPRYHCLIPDICGNCVLAVPAGEGRWTLPAFEQDGDWFAWASTAVARSATAQYGVPMTALREHSVGDCRVCELEIQAERWTPPAGTRWITRNDLAAAALSEPAVIEALAQRWPRNLPSVVAADRERGWMLMRDFGPRSLDGEPVARWQAANRAFSAIQIACSAELEPWRRLGCPDFRIPVLVARMDRLFGEDAALRIGEPGGLTIAKANRLRNLAPRLHDMWDELAGIPVPASVVHQDFRHGNLVMAGRTYIFYDWSDTVIGHPFFSCCRFLDYVPDDPHPRRGLSREERRRRIADAYLEPWAGLLGGADLKRALVLARRLNPVYVAIRRYLDTPYCEPTSSWGRALREGPAIELRRFLAGMDP